MNSNPYIPDACVCAIGVFDGVHVGHQALLGAVREDALARGAEAVAVTFDRDPDELFRPDQVHKLLTNKDRLAALRKFVPHVLDLHFDESLARQEWREFLDNLLSFLPGLKAIHVGTNFRCGTKAAGGIPQLKEWGAEHDVTITAEPLFIKDGQPVSASRIRALLAEGDVVTAAEFLTRPFALIGKVVTGAGRGTGLGFATANVEVDGHFAEMGPYVYAAYAVLEGERHKAAVSIGDPPTFSPETKEFNPLLLEAHLLDFEGDVYGKELRLEFVHMLRAMQRFDSQEELIATVKENIAWVHAHL